jgi:P27 family predicted phage terminase small subunit
MGRLRGARGKPHALKVLQGEKRKERLNPNEPKPEMKVIDPPEHLTEQAKKYWVYYFDVLYRMGIMTEADVKQLEIFCNACADELRFAKMIEEEGAIIQVENWHNGVLRGTEPKIHPAVRLLKQARDSIYRYGGSLALTPQDRSRIQVKPLEGEPEGIEAFIK